MTSLLSSISGQFGKSIFLGAMFPVLIVAVLNSLLTVPLLPSADVLQKHIQQIATGKETWGAILLVFAVVFVTGVLYNLNIPIIRMYEGYPWQESWLGWLSMYRKKEIFAHAGPLRYSMRYLRRQLQAANPNDPLAKELGAEQTQLARYINSELPDRQDFVLPTRFGNVIRCFERYSDVAYGIDAIIAWPRLVAKIDPGFASTIDEAKTSVDFMINCSLLCALSVLASGVIGLCQPFPWSLASVWHWGWRAGLFLALALIFYSFAIGRARAWGEQVKSAFDLYRFDLLKSLGYDQQPSTYFEEKALWDRICVQLLYADSRERPIPYKGTSPRVSASPAGVQLEIQRTMAPTAVNGVLEVRILVINKDSRGAKAVVLYETPPDGCKFIPDSARGIPPAGAAPAVNLVVRNVAPLELMLEQIAAGTQVTVGYLVRTTGV
jgi:hypothetical protein